MVAAHVGHARSSQLIFCQLLHGGTAEIRCRNIPQQCNTRGDPGSAIWCENIVEGRRSEVPRCHGHRGAETVYFGFRALEVACMLSDARGMAPDDLGPAGRRKLN